MGNRFAGGGRPPEDDEELVEFLEHAPVGVCWVDTDGRLLWTNETGLELLGCSEPECSGHPMAEYFVEPRAAADVLSRLGRSETVSRYEAGLRTGRGTTLQVLIGATNLLRNGRVVHSRWVIRDV